MTDVYRYCKVFMNINIVISFLFHSSINVKKTRGIFVYAILKNVKTGEYLSIAEINQLSLYKRLAYAGNGTSKKKMA